MQNMAVIRQCSHTLQALGRKGKVVAEIYNHAFIEKVKISQMQALSSLEVIAQDYGWDA